MRFKRRFSIYSPAVPGEQPDVLIYTELTRTLGADFPSARSALVRELLRWHPEIEPVRAAAGQIGVFRKLSNIERRALLDRARSRSLTSCVMLVNHLPPRNRMRLTEALKLRTDVAEADVFLDAEIHMRNPTLRAALLKQLEAFAVCTAALFTSSDAAALDNCDIVMKTSTPMLPLGPHSCATTQQRSKPSVIMRPGGEFQCLITTQWSWTSPRPAAPQAAWSRHSTASPSTPNANFVTVLRKLWDIDARS